MQPTAKELKAALHDQKRCTMLRCIEQFPALLCVDGVARHARWPVDFPALKQTNTPFNGLSPLLPQASTPRVGATQVFNFANVVSASTQSVSPSIHRTPSDGNHTSSAVVARGSGEA